MGDNLETNAEFLAYVARLQTRTPAATTGRTTKPLAERVARLEQAVVLGTHDDHR